DGEVLEQEERRGEAERHRAQRREGFRRRHGYFTASRSAVTVSSKGTLSRASWRRSASIFGIFASARSSSLSEPFAYAPSVTRSRFASYAATSDRSLRAASRCSGRTTASMTRESETVTSTAG